MIGTLLPYGDPTCMVLRQVHARMEDGNPDWKPGQDGPKGLFQVLDEEYDGIGKKEGLYDAHVTLEKLEESLDKAVERAGQKGDMSEVRSGVRVSCRSHVHRICTV